MLVGPAWLWILTFQLPPTIVPNNDSDALYIVMQGTTRQVFNDFSAFVSNVESRLDNGAIVQRFTASGRFIDADVVLTASLITVNLR